MYADPYEAYKYEDARKVLRFHGTVYLFRASSGWNPRSTMCMKSKLVEDADNMVHRTIEYYGIPTDQPQMPYSYMYIVVKLWMKAVRPKKVQPYIYAAEDKEKVEKEIAVEPVEKPPPTVPPTLVPRALGTYESKAIQDHFKEYVLYSDDKCLLTGEYNHTGRVGCTLWVTESAVNNPLSHCNFLITALCGNPAYNAYKYEKRICKDYDKYIRKI
uniref:Salivary lipocalin n=1 Tax=Hyalomma excavatum TaxID=257692 RepID=A0A131XM49_9ACAR